MKIIRPLLLVLTLGLMSFSAIAPVETIVAKATAFAGSITWKAETIDVGQIPLNVPKEIDFVTHSFIKILVWLTPIMNFSILVLAIILGGYWWSILALSLVLVSTIYFFYKSKIDIIHTQIDGCANVLSAFAEQIKWIETSAWKSELLIQIKDGLGDNEKKLHQEIDSLSKIIKRLDNRLNAIVGLFLNLFLQWDLRCLQQLHDWENVNQNKISNGFHKELIQYEKLHKSATLAIPSPDHYYPLLYILALQTDNDKVEFFNDKAVGGSLTMTSVKIG